MRSDVCAHSARFGPAGPAAPAGGAPPPRAAGDALGDCSAVQVRTRAISALSYCNLYLIATIAAVSIVSWCVPTKHKSVSDV